MLFRLGRVSVNTRKDGSISAGCGAEEWSGIGLVILCVISTYLTSGMHPVSDSLAQVTIFIVYVPFSVACMKGRFVKTSCHMLLDIGFVLSLNLMLHG